MRFHRGNHYWTLSCLWAFLLIALVMVLEVALHWDEGVLQWMGAQRNPSLTWSMQRLTSLGDGALEIPMALGAVALLWLLGHQTKARCLLLAGLSGELLYLVAKWWFARPRPRVIEHLSGAGWYSFPSGHAMLAPITWGLALLLFSRITPHAWVRISCLLLALVIPLGIGVSRIYLGVHYPSDVLAGLFLGTAWMLLWAGSTKPSRSCGGSLLPLGTRATGADEKRVL